jgi:hypothetical protein
VASVVIPSRKARGTPCSILGLSPLPKSSLARYRLGIDCPD